MNDTEIKNILNSFPELQNGATGLFNITALQIVAAFSKRKNELLKKLVLFGDVNQGDTLGRTPLHYAVLNGNYEMVETLLNHGADTECKFMYLCSLRTPHEDHIKWTKLYAMLPSPDAWGRTPLHLAAKWGNTDIATLLIKNNANVNSTDEKGNTPLLLAGHNNDKNAFENIVEILVTSGADVLVRNNITGTTPLFHAVVLQSTNSVMILLNAGAWLIQESCEQTELHAAAADGSYEILELFLNDPRITIEDINKLDGCGRTSLYKAALGGHKKCTRLLILRGGNLSIKSKTKESSIDVIFNRIAKPGNFLREIFDSNINSNNLKENDANYRFVLDFSTLAPLRYEHQMDIISNILVAANEREKLQILQHPLIETFLRLKWAKMRPFFALLISSHTLFVLSLSIYVILIIYNLEGFEVIRNVCRYFVIVTAAGLSGYGLIQCTLISRNFFQQYEICLNLISTILSFSMSITLTSDQRHTVQNGIPIWILHASSIAVLLAWIELMLLIGRFPTYGYYALMFAVVLRNVLKVLTTFVCLVIGFALSFSIQFHNYEQFSNPWRALVKTTVMMMGEFEYTDLFDTSPKDSYRLPTTSRIIFLFFIILASIVLMNLMIGLAASDIQGLQLEGHARRLEKQAEFLRQFEQVISLKFVESYWFPRCIRTFLKRRSSIPLRLAIHPDLAVSKKCNGEKLPCELIESLVKIAKNPHEQTIEIVEVLKLLLQKFENL